MKLKMGELILDFSPQESSDSKADPLNANEI